MIDGVKAWRAVCLFVFDQLIFNFSKPRLDYTYTLKHVYTADFYKLHTKTVIDIITRINETRVMKNGKTNSEYISRNKRFILMLLITRICWVNNCFDVKIQQSCKIIHPRECIFCEFFYNHAYFFIICLPWQKQEVKNALSDRE